MTLLFDLDGTLLDTAPDFAYAINTLRATLGKPALSIESIRPAVSHGVEAMLYTGFELKPTDPTYTSVVQQCIKLYQEQLAYHALPFPGILELLDHLESHQIAWGIVTNKPAFLTDPLIERLKLSHRAGCVVSGDTTSHSKPHPEPLLYACKKMSVQPEHCVYIGDAARDIEAGKAAGMFTIGALFGYIDSIEEALGWKADYYVHQATDIWPYLQDKWLIK
jgi:phosphoglycolate phosphatase